LAVYLCGLFLAVPVYLGRQVWRFFHPSLSYRAKAFSPEQLSKFYADELASRKRTEQILRVAHLYNNNGCDASLSELTVDAAGRFDPMVLAAMVVVESKCNPEAISRKGAIGLTQIMPFNVPPHEICRLLEPEYSIKTGASIITDLTGRHGLRRGLALYNGQGLEAERYADFVLAVARGRAKLGN
jgi:soluble lytic murein transglycosylase-like protein